MQVRDIMTEPVASCTLDTDLQQVAIMMVKCDCGAIPVIDPKTQKAMGIVTDRDIVCRTVAEGQNPVGMKVDDVMTMPISAINPNDSLEECLAESASKFD